MPAETRSLVSRVAPGAVARGAAQPGDIILAWSTASFGANADLTITGGGTWQPIGDFPATSWAGARVWGKTIGPDEPEEYTVTQDPLADGVVILHVIRNATLAGLQVTFDTSNMAPGLTPSSPSGIEIRYSAGIQSFGATTWAALPGYTQDQVQTGAITATLAARPYASTSELDAAGMLATPTPTAQRAVTLLIRSTDTGGGSGGGNTPTPQPFPVYAPAKGLSLARYTAHDLLTGEFRGDLTSMAVRGYDRRIGDVGAFAGEIPLGSARAARQIRDIIPEDETNLSSGPGRTVIHCWRDDQLTGIYWIHTAVEQRGARGGVALGLQGVTLDGYLAHVALLAGINLEEGDQIANARALLQIAMDDPGSNIGLTLQAGLSGTDRPLVADQDAYIGQILQNYARVDGGFESVINPRIVGGNLLRSWEWGSPKIDHPEVEHEFVEGESGGTIVSWSRTISALSGHTRLAVVGGTPEQTDITTASPPTRSELLTATAHRAAGWPIIDKRLRHDSADQAEVDAYASYWASRTQGSPRVFECTVLLGKGSSWTPNCLGQYARITLNNPRYPLRNGSPSFNKRMRIIGWSLTPAQRNEGRDTLTLTLEQEAL
ncbi:hypothetical protein ACIBG7_15280 [Nonomuraea sp. NPDC050328]|uniref:hypothetical protein n=1 Tax=Nonomuraea sp. NPDC050328 TaxID=3364361 RepID=UPI0037BDE049